MKAIVQTEYGSPSVLRLEEVETPKPGAGEVLIRVHAASVNPLDRHTVRGEPLLARLAIGLRKPRRQRRGVDVAGRVETAGKDFAIGDEVFGACPGAFAEYAVAQESMLMAKPPNVPFEQAAAVYVAGITALQALRKGPAGPGQQVLINGAAGGVGTFAVQLARHFGAEVTGVCSTRNVELVRSIGADHAVDYTRDDFTRSRYDLIVDCIGNRSLRDLRRALKPDGKYVMVGMAGAKWLGLIGILAAALVTRRVRLLMVRRSREDMTLLRDLLASGALVPVIDRTYPLSEVPRAIAYLEEGHARGKVVIAIA